MIGVTLLAGALYLTLARPTAGSRSDTPALYTASDPSRVGTTGLPQLVEFYHPG